MPNILKNFMKPKVSAYTFTETEELKVEQESPAPSVEGDLEHTPEKKQAVRADPTSPVDYAKIQADMIMEAARQEAEELLDRARESIEQELEELRASAQEEGRRQGFAEGMAAAEDEVRQARERQAVEMASQVREYLEKASQAREDFISHTTGELLDLTLAVAEKIIRISLKSSGEIVARMIHAATEKLKRKEWVHIYIAGCDAKGMARVAPGLMESLNSLSDHVRLIPMADDETGTCIIEMPDEIIDASVSTQLSNVRDLLSDRAGGEW